MGKEQGGMHRTQGLQDGFRPGFLSGADVARVKRKATLKPEESKAQKVSTA